MKKRYGLAISTAIVGFGLGVASAAQAVTITLSTADNQFTEGSYNQGWWSTESERFNLNDNFNDNYLTGKLRTNDYRSFFTFDLAALENKTVSSATLQIQRFIGFGKATHTLSLFDVSTSAIAVNQKENNPDINIYNDLGSGKNYGNFEVNTSGDRSEILSFNLNPNAIADINAASGKFLSIGGAIIQNFGTGDQYLFGFSNNAPVTLVVNTNPVPEPLTIGGTVVAGAMGWWIKQKRKERC